MDLNMSDNNFYFINEINNFDENDSKYLEIDFNNMCNTHISNKACAVPNDEINSNINFENSTKEDSA